MLAEQIGALGIVLDDPGRANVGQPLVLQPPALQHRAEHRASADLGCQRPRLQRLDRKAVAARDGDLGRLPFLAGLAAAGLLTRVPSGVSVRSMGCTCPGFAIQQAPHASRRASSGGDSGEADENLGVSASALPAEAYDHKIECLDEQHRR